jgi:hypothetical protein
MQYARLDATPALTFTRRGRPILKPDRPCWPRAISMLRALVVVDVARLWTRSIA